MDKLLEILSKNSNFSTTELALMLNEPEDYIKAQIKEYESNGIIKGYSAMINWEIVPDADVKALIELKVTPKPDTGFDEMADSVMHFEEVKTVFLMAGTFDLALVVQGHSMQDIASFVAKKLSTIDGVISTVTHFMLKCYKYDGVTLINNKNFEDKRSMIL